MSTQKNCGKGVKRVHIIKALAAELVINSWQVREIHKINSNYDKTILSKTKKETELF